MQQLFSDDEDMQARGRITAKGISSVSSIFGQWKKVKLRFSPCVRVSNWSDVMLCMQKCLCPGIQSIFHMDALNVLTALYL